MEKTNQMIRVTSVIASLTAGGIGPVCRYAAEGMAKLPGWKIVLLCLHDPVGETFDANSGLRVVSLGLEHDCPRAFLEWLEANPQDLVITSDVCHIEAAFPYFPQETRHIVQIHDSMRRYRDVPVRNSVWIDGVTCVGRHLEAPLRKSLDEVGFNGLLRTVHNGANFPPVEDREQYDGPLRLLFLGSVEALKGIFDFVPLLKRLKQMEIPVILNIVGGENQVLARKFDKHGIAESVRWAGRVPHEECYRIAAESDLFLMPSRKEPFGMVTIEAMSMGCVPIAYDVPSGSTEIIENGKNGILVSLGDIKGWAEQIRNLHYDRRRLVELSYAAISRARRDFKAEVMVRNLATLLTDVSNHSENQPSQRMTGQPSQTSSILAHPSRGYQRLPEWLRVWIRNLVYSSPRLSHWLLSR